jgi:hypothetical protein
LNDTAVAAPDGFTRPEPPYEAPDGYRWEAVQDPGDWTAAGPDRKCRYRGRTELACGKPAVLAVTRGIARRVRWYYCADDALEHYGRWLEDGKAVMWKLQEGAAE